MVELTPNVMKSFFVSSFFAVAVTVALAVAGAGCTHDDTAYQAPRRRAIPLAPVGATSPGIGGPGGGSADTRATGTVASGEGDTPVGVTEPASAPVVAPGVAPGSGIAGARGTGY